MTDSNSVMAQFAGFNNKTLDVGNATVTVTVSENKITLTPSAGKLNASGRAVLLSATKTGIPSSNEAKLIAYASSYQDVVSGGSASAPTAYFSVNVNIKQIAVNSANITKNTQSENMSTSASATIVSTNHIYTVPNTVGMGYEKALLLLKESGFTVESEEEYNDNIEYGHVIRQSVQAGEQFEKPQVIELIVSKGKEKIGTDTSEVSSNSKVSSESVNENGEYIDYNSDNSSKGNEASNEENSLNSGNLENSDNSKNDSEYSDVISPEQSFIEPGGQDGGEIDGGGGYAGGSHIGGDGADAAAP